MLKRLFNPFYKYNFLEIELKGNIPEQTVDINIPFLKKDEVLTVWEISDLFTFLGNTDLYGVIIKIRNLNIGLSRANNIRKSIERLREKGKKVFTYLENPGNTEYIIGTAADTVYMSKWSILNLIGFHSENYFLKGLLENFEIEPLISGLGEYKSASETFTRKKMSKENKEMTLSIIKDHTDNLVNIISNSRNIKPPRLKELINNAPYMSNESIKSGLIDKICYEEELTSEIEKEIDVAVNSVTYEKISRYINIDKKLFKLKNRFSGKAKEIALVTVDGLITHGISKKGAKGLRTTGSESLIKSLEKVYNDNSVGALVIRILSPGGSALASDLIRSKVNQISDKIPVIVSMSDVSASGGYMISTGGNYLFVDEFTLTGSIGVISGKFNFENFLKKFGIDVEIHEESKNASFFSISKGFTDDEQKKLLSMINEMYRMFVDMVSKSRNMTYNETDKVSRGRVWTGLQAKKIKLVDDTGDYFDAFTKAYELIDQETGKYFLIKEFKEKLKLDFSGVMGSYGLINKIELISEICKMYNKERILAIMPFWFKNS